MKLLLAALVLLISIPAFAQSMLDPDLTESPKGLDDDQPGYVAPRPTPEATPSVKKHKKAKKKSGKYKKVTI